MTTPKHRLVFQDYSIERRRKPIEDRNRVGRRKPKKPVKRKKRLTPEQLKRRDTSLKRKRHALHNITLESEPGKLIAIIGKSGSGKTTILKAASGGDREDRFKKRGGALLLDDRNVDEMSDITRRQKICYVAQKAEVFPTLSIFENITLAISERLSRRDYKYRLRNGKIREEVERLLKLVGLWEEVEDKLDVPASELSGGQQQRLCLARALVVDAAVYLFDEQTSALDLRSKQIVMNAILELAKTKAVMMVTHDMDLAWQADHIVVVENGRIKQQGTPAEILAHSESIFHTSEPVYSTPPAWMSTFDPDKAVATSPSEVRAPPMTSKEVKSFWFHVAAQFATLHQGVGHALSRENISSVLNRDHLGNAMSAMRHPWKTSLHVLDATREARYRFAAWSSSWSIILMGGGLALTVGIGAEPALSHFGWDFFTGSGWNFPAAGSTIPTEAGIWPAVKGTFLTTGIASLIAIPAGVSIAVFLNEICPSHLRKWPRLNVELLASISSVIFGVYGSSYFSHFMGNSVQPWLSDTFDGVPILSDWFSGLPYGNGILPTSFVLAAMITPYIASLSYDVIRSVSPGVRQAGYDLGLGPWRVFRRVILPIAAPALVNAAMIGIMRALGEAMAVSYMIGGDMRPINSLFESTQTLASLISLKWQEAGDLQISALMAAGGVLLATNLLFYGAKASIVSQLERRLKSPSNAGWVRNTSKWAWHLASASVTRTKTEASDVLFPFAHQLAQFLDVESAYQNLLLQKDCIQDYIRTFLIRGRDRLPLAELLDVNGAYQHLRRELREGREGFKTMLAAGVCAGAGTVGTAIVAGLIYNGASALSLSTFTQSMESSGNGLLNAMYGTGMTAGMSLILGNYLGFWSAWDRIEHPDKLRTRISRITLGFLLTASTTLFGIEGYEAFVTHGLHSYSAVAAAASLLPLSTSFQSINIETSLKAILPQFKEAAKALGMSSALILKEITRPMAKAGIATAKWLILPRLGSETAPLLLTALGNNNWTSSLLAPIGTLALAVNYYAGIPKLDHASAAALVLTGLTFGFTIAARLYGSPLNAVKSLAWGALSLPTTFRAAATATLAGTQQVSYRIGNFRPSFPVVTNGRPQVAPIVPPSDTGARSTTGNDLK